MTTGPYRYVRNPMAMAGIGQGIAVAIAFDSWPVFIYVILGGLAWQVVVRPHEEADMLERFGQEYESYRGRVRCWWPMGK